jgi:hypothetical protein
VLELRPLADAALPARRQELLERTVDRRVRSSFERDDQAREAAEKMLARSTLRHYDVVADGRAVGWLAWYHGHDEADVHDLVLDDPARSAELLPLLLELARADGARFLGIATVPGEPVREPLADADGFVRRATNMALPLDGEIGDPGEVELRPMTQEEFEAYITGSTEQYIG